jgi:Cu(I)/Ag(I) efflux system membrane fusion protein
MHPNAWLRSVPRYNKKNLLKSGMFVEGAVAVDAAAQLKGKKSMMNEVGVVITGHEGHDGMGLTKEGEKIDVNPVFQKSFVPFLNSYMELKDALVLSDPIKVQQASDKALTQLKRVNSSAVKGAVVDQISTLEKSFMVISKTASIEKQ